MFGTALVMVLAMYTDDTLGFSVGALVLALAAAGLAMLVAVIALAARVRRMQNELAEARSLAAEKEGGGCALAGDR